LEESNLTVDVRDDDSHAYHCLGNLSVAFDQRITSTMRSSRTVLSIVASMNWPEAMSVAAQHRPIHGPKEQEAQLLSAIFILQEVRTNLLD
jgi:hypothetical protein